jgi:hypothetical protein
VDVVERIINGKDSCNADTKEPCLSKQTEQRTITAFIRHIIPSKRKQFLQLMLAAPALEATRET